MERQASVPQAEKTLSPLEGFERQRLEHSHNQELKRLQDFVENHPESILTRAKGGLNFGEIAVRTDIPSTKIGKLLGELDLPAGSLLTINSRERARLYYESHKAKYSQNTREWQKKNPEKVKESARKAHKKYRAKVIRIETCQNCGNEFPWTNQREISRKRTHVSHIACGRSCSRSLANLKRSDESKLTGGLVNSGVISEIIIKGADHSNPQNHST